MVVPSMFQLWIDQPKPRPDGPVAVHMSIIDFLYLISICLSDCFAVYHASLDKSSPLIQCAIAAIASVDLIEIRLGKSQR